MRKGTLTRTIKFLLLFAILVRSSYDGRSQSLNPNDTITFKIYQVQSLLIAAKQKKAADSIVADLRVRISLLTDKINSYEKIAKDFLDKDTLNADIKALFSSKVETMKEQRTILEQTVKDFKKEIRRWKRKVRWTAIGGIVVAGGLTYLYITK